MATIEQRPPSTRQHSSGPASAEDIARPVVVDTPTLISVSALAWAAANVCHEIVGHAGAALLLGVPVRAVSTTTASLEWEAITSATDDRIINAAATPVNVVTGVVALAALRWLRSASEPMRYFLWLFAAVSFTMATWNMVTLPILGGGDWGEVAEGLDRAGLWAVVTIAVGIVVAIAGFRMPLRLFLPDLGEQPLLRRKILVVAVATMLTVQTVSVLLSPFGTAPAEANHLLASVFAYVHLIGWAFLVDRGVGPRTTRRADDLALRRSTGWLSAGIAAALVFIVVLGPGLGPLEDDPRLDASSSVIAEDEFASDGSWACAAGPPRFETAQ